MFNKGEEIELHENRPDLYIWDVPVLIKHMNFTIIENIQGWLVSFIFFPWNCLTKWVDGSIMVTTIFFFLFLDLRHKGRKTI